MRRLQEALILTLAVTLTGCAGFNRQPAMLPTAGEVGVERTASDQPNDPFRQPPGMLSSEGKLASYFPGLSRPDVVEPQVRQRPPWSWGNLWANWRRDRLNLPVDTFDQMPAEVAPPYTAPGFEEGLGQTSLPRDGIVLTGATAVTPGQTAPPATDAARFATVADAAGKVPELGMPLRIPVAPDDPPRKAPLARRASARTGFNLTDDLSLPGVQAQANVAQMLASRPSYRDDAARRVEARGESEIDAVAGRDTPRQGVTGRPKARVAATEAPTGPPRETRALAVVGPLIELADSEVPPDVPPPAIEVPAASSQAPAPESNPEPKLDLLPQPVPEPETGPEPEVTPTPAAPRAVAELAAESVALPSVELPPPAPEPVALPSVELPPPAPAPAPRVDPPSPAQRREVQLSKAKLINDPPLPATSVAPVQPAAAVNGAPSPIATPEPTQVVVAPVVVAPAPAAPAPVAPVPVAVTAVAEAPAVPLAIPVAQAESFEPPTVKAQVIALPSAAHPVVEFEAPAAAVAEVVAPSPAAPAEVALPQETLVLNPPAEAPVMVEPAGSSSIEPPFEAPAPVATAPAASVVESAPEPVLPGAGPEIAIEAEGSRPAAIEAAATAGIEPLGSDSLATLLQQGYEPPPGEERGQPAAPAQTEQAVPAAAAAPAAINPADGHVTEVGIEPPMRRTAADAAARAELPLDAPMGNDGAMAPGTEATPGRWQGATQALRRMGDLIPDLPRPHYPHAYYETGSETETDRLGRLWREAPETATEPRPRLSARLGERLRGVFNRQPPEAEGTAILCPQCGRRHELKPGATLEIHQHP